MAIIAVTGDASTTTSLALASSWPVTDDVLLVEADPTGGDLAAWLDIPVAPSLSAVVTRVLDGSWPEVERLTRLTESGLRVVPAPARAGEASQAVAESARSLVTTLATLRTPVSVVDAGALPSSPSAHPFVGAAAVTIAIHRQSTQSANAAGVRLQRFADQLDAFAGTAAALVVAVVGAAPFDIGEIEHFLGDSVGASAVVGLPVDDLAAGVFGGRTGVSSRRLARLPLMRATRDLAVAAERSLADVTGALWRAAR